MGKLSSNYAGDRSPPSTNSRYASKMKVADLKSRSRTRSYGPFDNFSFDARYVPFFQTPSLLVEQLPKELVEEVTDWTKAGAAVYAALERISRLNNEAAMRANLPNLHLSAHIETLEQTDTPNTATSGGTRSYSSESSSVSSLAQDFESMPTCFSSHLPPSTHDTESQPLTPSSTQGSSAPPSSLTDSALQSEDPGSSPCTTVPPSPENALSTFPSGNLITNPMAWESYVKVYNEEIFDIRTRAMPRFENFAVKIDKLISKLDGERDETGMSSDSLREFKDWWAIMQPQVGANKLKVDALQERRLVGGVW